MLWPVQPLGVTWVGGLGWQERPRSPCFWVLLSDRKISLPRVFGSTTGLFPSFPWVKDVFKAQHVPSAWGQGAMGRGELTPGPRAALPPEVHTQLLLAAERSRNAPYRHDFHPAPQKRFPARTCPRTRVYGPGAGMGDTREPGWLHGAARAGPCVSRSLSTGQLGGAGGGWEGDGDVGSTVGSPQAPSPGLGPAPAAQGCAMTLQGPEIQHAEGSRRLRAPK